MSDLDKVLKSPIQDVESLMDAAGEEAGWGLYTKYDILVEFIDANVAPADFKAFIASRIEEHKQMQTALAEIKATQPVEIKKPIDPRTFGYGKTIFEATNCVEGDVKEIEEIMRDRFHTLDHLSREDFFNEAKIAQQVLILSRKEEEKKRKKGKR